MVKKSNENWVSKTLGRTATKMFTENQDALKWTALAGLGSEAIDHIPIGDLAKKGLMGAASAGMIGKMNVPGIKESYEGKDIADLMMHSLNTGLAGYGVLAKDKEAIQTSALMSFLFAASHEAQENLEEKYENLKKELAAKIPGLPLLVEEDEHAHDDGGHHHHGHDHGPLYSRSESTNLYRLDAEEQDTLLHMLEPEAGITMQRIQQAYNAWEKLKEQGHPSQKAIHEFQEKHGFLIMHSHDDHDHNHDHHDHDHHGHHHHGHDHLHLEDLHLIADSYEAFKERFSNMIYQKQTKDGNWVDVHAREIKKGDTIKVQSGQRIPADGNVLEVNGSQQGATNINASDYSGDKEKEIYYTAPVYQMGELTGEGQEIVFQADADYWQSTGIGMLQGFNAKTAAKPQDRLKKFIDKYVKVMLAGGAFVFFKDAINKSKEGTFLDLGQLKSKKNIQSTFEYFVSAAPCPLAASMLIYKGIEEELKATGTYVQDRNQLIEAKDTDVVVFDITGTLTEGYPEIDEEAIVHDGDNLDELMATAFLLETKQKHPIAESVRNYTRDAALSYINKHDTKLDKEPQKLQLDGRVLQSGVDSKIDGRAAHIGNLKHFKDLKEYYDRKVEAGKRDDNPITQEQLDAMEDAINNFMEAGDDRDMRDSVIVWKENEHGTGGDWAMLGNVDRLRENAKETIDALVADGKEVVIATGSSQRRAEGICHALETGRHGDKVRLYADLTPGNIEETKKKTSAKQKWSLAEETEEAPIATKTDVIHQYQQEGKKVMMIGDGVNDSQAIEMADVSVGMQSTATGIVQRSAGIMVKEIDEPLRLIRLSKDVDQTMQKTTRGSGIWMGFLVALHFLGQKTKEWFGFELGAKAKGILHEGSTLYVTAYGIKAAERLAKEYEKFDISKGGEIAR